MFGTCLWCLYGTKFPNKLLKWNMPRISGLVWTFMVRFGWNLPMSLLCAQYLIQTTWSWKLCINVPLWGVHLWPVFPLPLRWRHNGLDSVSNNQPHDCLLNRLFRRRSKKTSKLRVTGLCVGNSPGTGEFPAQMASYAENVSIWWRHHAKGLLIGHAFPCHNVVMRNNYSASLTSNSIHSQQNANDDSN